MRADKNSRNSDAAHGDEFWRDRVNEIMRHFDFATVRRVMTFLDWRWQKVDGREVPTETELRQKARRIIGEAISFGDGGFCKSGGLAARRYGEMVELSFEVESHEAYKEK